MQKLFPTTILYGANYNPEQWPESVWLEDMRLIKLVHMLCQQAGVGPFIEPVAGLEVTRRVRGDECNVYFILNHNDSPQQVTLPPGTYTSLLDGSEQQGDVAIAERDVLILLEK